MYRLIPIALLTVCMLPAQTKKIVVRGDAKLIQDFQSVTDKARIVAITDQNAMTELADADAYIGNIKPEEVRAGKKLKWVAIMSAGAYGFVMASNYNSRPLPAEALVRANKIALIRKRQTWEDLVRGEAE